ncbi:MAG: TerB N-terminal domain-containing protein [archaeon]|nr:TerB N-terminal domain-containing protein [archaeon]
MPLDDASLPFGYLYEQVKAHADDRGTEHPYEECRLWFPSYTTMTPAMEGYYLWWRTNLLEGRYLKTNDAYVKLFVYEAVALGHDPSGLLEQLKIVNDHGDVSKFALHSLAADLCVHAGLPFPDWMWFPSDDLVLFWRGSMLSTPACYHFQVFKALNDPFSDYWPDDEKALITMLNHALRAIDGYLRETTGRDLVTTCSDEEIRFGYQPFPGFGIPGCGPKVLKCYRFGNYAANMFNGIYAYCFKKLFDVGPRVPSDFPKELRSVIDSLPKDLKRWEGPDTALPNVRDMDGTEDVGAVLPLLNIDYADPSPKFKEDIRAYSEVTVDGPLEYVPSGFRRSDYRHLSDRSREYYFYWRTCVRKGSYPPTDIGYLWLYCCELINTRDRPQETLDLFYRLTRAYCANITERERYEWSFTRFTVRQVCLEYAVFNGLQVPSVSMCPGDVSGCMTFVRFLEDGGTPPDEELLIAMAGLKKNQYLSVDRDVAAVMGRVLFRANKESKGGILSCGYVHDRTIKGRIFEYVKFFGYKGHSRSFEVSLPDLFSDGYWHDSIHDLLLAVVARVRLFRGTSKKKPEHCKCFGMVLDGIIDEETRAYFKSVPVAKEVRLDMSKVDDAQKSLDDVMDMLSVPERKPVKAEVVLDLSKVDAAQKSLDEVTDMMAVPEQEQTVEEVPVEPKRGRPKKTKAVEKVPVPAEETPVPVKEDMTEPSWGPGLKSRLDEFQTEYLRALSEDPSACPYILRLSKTSRGRMEDSINAVALETVGDTLLGGGEIVKEYLDTVKGLFR